MQAYLLIFEELRRQYNAQKKYCRITDEYVTLGLMKQISPSCKAHIIGCGYFISLIFFY